MLLKKKKNSQIFEGIVPYSTSQVILIPGLGLLTCGRYWRDPELQRNLLQTLQLWSVFILPQESDFCIQGRKRGACGKASLNMSVELGD